ncbi:MAG TPA: hypothetical protein VGP67_02265 [Gaiellales bacterium]|nr:hypothetical protein [Gaiellales bacterium]
MTATRNQLVDRYLADLHDALRDLPRRQRDELVGEIEAHIDEALPSGASDAEVRTLLDRLGEPEQIADAERERLGIDAPSVGWLERLTIPLLLIGGVVIPVVGWIVGLVFLWLSRCWSTRDKLIGTLVVPGGLLPAAYLALSPTSTEECVSGTGIDAAGRHFTTHHCTGGLSTSAQIGLILLEVFLVVAPIYTAIRLARHLPARERRGERGHTAFSRRQALAIFLVGLTVGGVAVWLYLSTR